ncbi:hypothetical protein PLESTB_000866400 [Pleodorina starrii]|uniref:Uncharacterized protein n=1 Tax=Pleodorina starrii TaxID=330485 RepID=A0A9W6F2R1_9CHLO|nr:hypothetical protein PLESTB_000866400 [Pleodorina starrii]
MSLKELKSLAPWNWDPQATKHPPKKAALQDFEKDGASQTPGPARDRRRSAGLLAATNPPETGWETSSANGLARKVASADRARSLLKRKAADLRSPESQQQKQPAAQQQRTTARDPPRDRAPDPEAASTHAGGHPAAVEPPSAPPAQDRKPDMEEAAMDEVQPLPAGGGAAASGDAAAAAAGDDRAAGAGALPIHRASEAATAGGCGTALVAANHTPVPTPRDLFMRPPRWTPAAVRGPAAAQLEPSPASIGAPGAALSLGGGGTPAGGSACKRWRGGSTPAAAGRLPDGKRGGPQPTGAGQQKEDFGGGRAIAPPPTPCFLRQHADLQPLATSEDATPNGARPVAALGGSALLYSSPVTGLTGRMGAGGGACGAAAAVADVPCSQDPGGRAAAGAAGARPVPSAVAVSNPGSTPLAQAGAQRPCGPLLWHDDGLAVTALTTSLSVDRRTPQGCGTDDLPWLSPAPQHLAAARTARPPLQRQLSSSSPTPPPCFEPSPSAQQQEQPQPQQQRDLGSAGCVASGGHAAPFAAPVGGCGIPDSTAAAVAAASARPSLLKLTPTTHKRFVLQGAIVEGISSAQPRTRTNASSPVGPPPPQQQPPPGGSAQQAATNRPAAAAAVVRVGGGSHAQEDGQDFDPAATRSPTLSPAFATMTSPKPPVDAAMAAVAADLSVKLQDVAAVALPQRGVPQRPVGRVQAVGHDRAAAGEGDVAPGAGAGAMFGDQAAGALQPAADGFGLPSRSPLAVRQAAMHMPFRSGRGAKAAGFVARKLVLLSAPGAAEAAGGGLGPDLGASVGPTGAQLRAAGPSADAVGAAAAPRVSASGARSDSACAGQRDGGGAAAENKGTTQDLAGLGGTSLAAEPTGPKEGEAGATAAAAGLDRADRRANTACAASEEAGGSAVPPSVAAVLPREAGRHYDCCAGEDAADVSEGAGEEETRPAKRPRATEALPDTAGTMQSAAAQATVQQVQPRTAAAAAATWPPQREAAEQPVPQEAASLRPAARREVGAAAAAGGSKAPAAELAASAAAAAAPAAADQDVVMAAASPAADDSTIIPDLPAVTLSQQQLLVLDQLLGFFRATGCRHPSVMSAAELVAAISRFCQAAGIPVVPANIQTLASWLGTLLALEKPVKAYAQAQAQARARAQREPQTAASDAGALQQQQPQGQGQQAQGQQQQQREAQPVAAPGSHVPEPTTAAAAAAAPAAAPAASVDPGSPEAGGAAAGAGAGPERRVSCSSGPAPQQAAHDRGADDPGLSRAGGQHQQPAAQGVSAGSLEGRPCSQGLPGLRVQQLGQQQHLQQQQRQGWQGKSILWRWSSSPDEARKWERENSTGSLPLLPLDLGATSLSPTPLEALAAEWSSHLSPLVTALYDHLASCQHALRSALLSAAHGAAPPHGAQQQQRRPSSGSSAPSPSFAATAAAVAKAAAAPPAVVAAARQEAQAQPLRAQYHGQHTQAVLAQQLQLLLARQQQSQQQQAAPPKPSPSPNPGPAEAVGGGAGSTSAPARCWPPSAHSTPTGPAAQSWTQARSQQTQQPQQQTAAAAAPGAFAPRGSSGGGGGGSAGGSGQSTPQDPRPPRAPALVPAQPPISAAGRPAVQPQPAAQAVAGATAAVPGRSASQGAWAAAGGSLGAPAAGPAAQRPAQQQQQQQGQAQGQGQGTASAVSLPAAAAVAGAPRAAASGNPVPAQGPLPRTFGAASTARGQPPPPPPAQTASQALPAAALTALQGYRGRDMPVARALQPPSSSSAAVAAAAPVTITSGAPGPYLRQQPGISAAAAAAAADASLLQPSPVQPTAAMTGLAPAAVPSYTHAMRQPYGPYPSAAAAGHGWHYAAPYGWGPSYGRAAGRAAAAAPEPGEPFGYPYPPRGAAAPYFHTGTGAAAAAGVHPSAAPQASHSGAPVGFDSQQQQQQQALASAKAANRRVGAPGLAWGGHAHGYGGPAAGQPYGPAPAPGSYGAGMGGAPGWGCG